MTYWVFNAQTPLALVFGQQNWRQNEDYLQEKL